MSASNVSEVEIVGTFSEPARVFAVCSTCDVHAEMKFKPFEGFMGLACPYCGTNGFAKHENIAAREG